MALAHRPAPVAAGIGEVVPHDIDVAELGQQFARLAVQILPIFRDVAILVGLAEFDILTHGMQAIDRHTQDDASR